jgi:hypothetical protein
MTDHRQDPTTAGDDLDRFQHEFGRSLVAAAREHEAARLPHARPARRRRGAAIGIAVAAAATVLIVTALPSPGDHDAPLLGASPAEAAVQELRRSLHEGVLIRKAETTNFGRTTTHETEEDWTDLATRAQHVRVTRPDPDDTLEYWNPSDDERWTSGGRRRAPDGRRIVEHTKPGNVQNISGEQSPAEEVDDLLTKAKDGEVVVVRRAVEHGKPVVVLERRERCYSTPDNLTGMCRDPKKPSRWPDDGPAGMRPVTSFQTWWLEEGATPRMLRYENGNVTRGSTKREVVYRSRYTRWDVLPATPKTLSLVRPPAFPADEYLVQED